MRTQGKIIKWKDDKGFGFVTPDEGGKDIFIHKNSFLNLSKKPEVGSVITFDILSTLEGKAWGVDILFHGQKDPRNEKLITSTLTSILLILISFTSLASLSYFTYLKIIPIQITAVYFGISIMTFIIYRHDKLAAESNNWRTNEKLLHLLSLIGGWPGALIAQRTLHHKSKKINFQLVFWIIVFFNVTFITFFTVHKYEKFNQHEDFLNSISNLLLK